MRVLLTGRDGQVGRAFAQAAAGSRHEILALSRGELDIRNRAATIQAVSAARPDVVVNAAAYTTVDAAEEEPGEAHRVNAIGPWNLALAGRETGAALVHLSTDYVFDGRIRRPYLETDPPAPISVYGCSKLAGELAVQETLDQHVIVRLSWVFGPYGRNFVKTVLRLAGQRDELQVVADQRGCPTYAGDVGEALLIVAETLYRRDPGCSGLYHFCGTPAVTWHEFAEAIVASAKRFHGLPVREVHRIATSAYPTPAVRPPDSTLDCTRFAREFGAGPRPWALGLERTLETLLGQAGLERRGADGRAADA